MTTRERWGNTIRDYWDDKKRWNDKRRMTGKLDGMQQRESSKI